MRSKKALINIISSLMLQLITLICGLILPRAIIEKYGSSVNGLVASITQFLAYITLLESGIGPVIKAALYKPIANKNQKEIEKILKAAQKFFNIITYVFVGYLILLCFIYPIFVNSDFSSMYTISLILIISISTFAEYFFGMIYRLYLQSEQKTYITSYIQAITTILNTIISLVLIKFGASIHIVKLVSTSIFIFRPLLQNIYVKKKYNINLKNVVEEYNLKQKWDGLAQHIAAVIHGNADVTLLTMFSSTVEVSVYTVYMFVIKGVKNIIQSFSSGIDASFGDMYASNEHENLNRSFKIYEFFYFTIITIVFSCTIGLILPFVQVYTLGVTDVDYSRPIFAYIITIAEFMWAIRLPYSSLVLSAGHFKETKNGAWFEAISNIVISTILIFKFGIDGVAAGTLFAMTARTIEFMYHCSKNILKRKIINSYIHLIITIVEASIVTTLINIVIKNAEFVSYLIWIKYGIISAAIALIVVLPINCLIYRKECKEFINIIKKNMNRREKILK